MIDYWIEQNRRLSVYYKQFVNNGVDQNGFVLADDGDSLLFSGLSSAILGHSVVLDMAFNGRQWHRKPLYNGNAFLQGQSKSTISRDMLLGVLWWVWYTCKEVEDADAKRYANQLIEHAFNHFGIMGQAADVSSLVGRCLISPGLLCLAAWISYRLGGPSRPYLRFLPIPLTDGTLTGYRAHLEVLHILLKREVTENEDIGVETCMVYADKNPRNALFLFAAGRYLECQAALNDSTRFPLDSVPTGKHYTSHWLWQREDDHPSNNPAEKKDVSHHMADWLFVDSLLRRKLLL